MDVHHELKNDWFQQKCLKSIIQQLSAFYNNMLAQVNSSPQDVPSNDDVDPDPAQAKLKSKSLRIIDTTTVEEVDSIIEQF